MHNRILSFQSLRPLSVFVLPLQSRKERRSEEVELSSELPFTDADHYCEPGGQHRHVLVHIKARLVLKTTL